jgi:endonuclease/exonuclease/phosphatase family metal-dependent hydrolase
MFYIRNKHILTILFVLIGFVNNVDAQVIRLFSFNVYFNDETGNIRYPKIIELMKENEYNVISLQECTPKFVSMLFKDEKFKHYKRSYGDSSHGYQNLVLTSLKVITTGDIKLPTNMGRSAPYIVLDDSTIVASVHLESGIFDTDIRKQQINHIFSATVDYSTVIIAGDLNFSDGDNEEKLLLKFHDLGAKEKQVTYDVSINKIASKTKHFFETSKRLDRIYVKCPACKIQGFSVIKTNQSDHWPINVDIYMN